MRRNSSQENGKQDFSKYLSHPPASAKDRLIQQCQKLNVSIYVDDATESASGFYANLRAVASEAELEKRLNARKAISFAQRSFVLALLALVVSTASFVKSFFFP